ncbi:TetR family transcriptional regulator [Vibrio pectenicida]|uniref:TetR family transcriptional regulator n=1 Tax=Vibrio pectenicida TaxID=62763 RepID=A0A7Y3ZZV3_9VIBR|nr:TetR family transcriptional regulator C-terminal domain-containing protein [Vibrio pectenicida]NOH72120.1 TetR family transcriptional regulator [Vibrio pectenicida]
MISTSFQLAPKTSKETKLSSARVATQANIQRAAEGVFAEFGYKGATMERIAQQSGMSKQNLLYYFSSKDLLYRTVLQNIVDTWLERMVFAEQKNATPEQLIEQYIRGKLQLSHDNPDASKVFAQEIISGAPIIRDYLKAHLEPLFNRNIKLVEGWVDEGRLRRTEPDHLFIAIWAMTQTYADFATQIELVLDKQKLEQPDFDLAAKFLTDMVLNGILASK